MSLRPEVPLDHRLAQVAQRRHDRHHDAVDERLADGPGVDEVDHDDRDQNGRHGAADQALPALVGADGRGQLVAAHGGADQQRGHVVGHGHDDGGQQEGDAVAVRERVGIEQQRGERAEGAHPHEHEDGRGEPGHRVGRRFHLGQVPDEGAGDEEHEHERQRGDALVVGLDQQREQATSPSSVAGWYWARRKAA